MLYYVVVQSKSSLECEIVERFYSHEQAKHVNQIVNDTLKLARSAYGYETFVTHIDPREESIFIPYRNETMVSFS